MKEGKAGHLLAALVIVVFVTGCASSSSNGQYAQSPEKASQANAQLGANYLRAGNLERANAKLQKALQQDRKNVDAHVAFALLNMRLDKPDKAREHFETALDLDPDSPQLQNNYGTFLCEQGDYEDGIEQFLKAAKNRLYDTPAYAYANAGRCARSADLAAAAGRYLSRALERDPRLPSALRQSAELALDRGRARQAHQYFDRYEKVAQLGPATLWLGVQIERALGNRAAAEEYGVRLLQEHRDSRQAKRFLETRDGA